MFLDKNSEIVANPQHGFRHDLDQQAQHALAAGRGQFIGTVAREARRGLLGAEPGERGRHERQSGEGGVIRGMAAGLSGES